MLLDTDDKIKQVGQTTATQIEHLEYTAKKIKEFAEINYTSKITEEIYNVVKGVSTKYLYEFYACPSIPIFRLGDQSFEPAEQEKMFQWLVNRVNYWKTRHSLKQDEIISFTVS